MQFQPFTHNGNTVSIHGRLFFIVSSNSRAGLVHFVDLEGFEKWPTVCGCESWKYGDRRCRHILACVTAIAHWLNLHESIREEWIERIMFLMAMRKSFYDALASDYVRALQKQIPAPKPKRHVRQYTLPVNV